MRVLLIGGTGNLSADCAETLVRRGHEVAVVTRGRSPVPAGTRGIVADRADARALTEALRAAAPEVVVDFLAFTPSDLEPLAGALAGRVRQLVFISSATVYAKPHPVPLTEASPLGNAWSAYARDKQDCEAWLAARGRDLPFTIVRPSHTFSPRWIPNVVSSAGYTFARRLLEGRPVFVPGDGESPWTLTTARDFAAGLAGLVGNAAALGEAFHITSDTALTWNRIVDEIARSVGASAPVVERIPLDFICRAEPALEAKLRGDKANAAVFDNAKIKRAVPGFECRDTVRDGLAASAAWFEMHPERKVADPAVDEIWDRVLRAWRGRKDP
jgi:nucleoside-diphosphate-sugar epimerase